MIKTAQKMQSKMNHVLADLNFWAGLLAGLSLGLLYRAVCHLAGIA